jgi:hypothetical protein
VAAGVATSADTLAIAVLAILVMAPAGAIAIQLTYRRLLSPPAAVGANGRIAYDDGTST